MALRAIHYIIHPVIVDDDGTNLRAVEVAPITVPASELAAFPERMLNELATTEPPA